MESATYKTEPTITYTRSVYQVLCYFDIFNYPLAVNEIHSFCPEKMDLEILKGVLDLLQNKGKIRQHNNYYYLASSSASIIESRLRNEALLEKTMQKIKRYARLVIKFPFVKAVFISGSVSKGVLSEEGDVDYFIIAEGGRVWICRTLLVVFKKTVLLNSKKYFCVNYFVDTNNLMVPDNNLFVATEIKTLVPVFENETAKQFRTANKWSAEMFPNCSREKPPVFKGSESRPLLCRIIETLCHGKIGEKLDNYFFNRTLKHWQKKFPHFDSSRFDLDMRSYKNVSKHHPQGNQAKVLNALAFRMSHLEK